MKLTDFDNSQTAVNALKENFGMNLDLSKLGKADTKSMLNKVSALIKEAREAKDFYKNQNNPNYLKLMFVKEALSRHYNLLPKTKIVVENEEVEKSQVILAAQDMVDSVQKMVEEVNDMLVKELPALVSSIQSEIGAMESTNFNETVSGSLTTLNQTLSQSRTELQNALNTLTGQTDMSGFNNAGGQEKAVTDIANVGDTSDVDDQIDVDMDIDLEEPEDSEPEVGREKR